MIFIAVQSCRMTGLMHRSISRSATSQTPFGHTPPYSPLPHRSDRVVSSIALHSFVSTACESASSCYFGVPASPACSGPSRDFLPPTARSPCFNYTAARFTSIATCSSSSNITAHLSAEPSSFPSASGSSNAVYVLILVFPRSVTSPGHM